MPVNTHTDFIVATGVPGLWVRLHNNSTGTDYFSSAVTDSNGAFTYSAPPGDYSLYVGFAATAPGTPTLRNAHYPVPVTAGDDIAASSLTSTIGPYTPTAVAGGEDFSAAVRIAGGKPWIDVTHPLYGAKGDGVTNDLPAINAAVAASIAANGVPIFFPAGNYLVNGPIVISPAGSLTADVPVPPFISLIPAGRIGDTPNDNGLSASVVQILASGTFPIGEFVIDYKPVVGGEAWALVGGGIQGIGVKCASRGAGIRIANPRRWHVEDVDVNNPATPAPADNRGNPQAGFSVVQFNATASAYNLFENVMVSFAAQDSFHHNCADIGTYIGPCSLNPGRYNFNLGASGNAFVKLFGPHYEKGTYGFNIQGGNGQISIFGATDFGIPTSGAVRFTPMSGGLLLTKFIGGTLHNAPGAAPGEEAGSMVQIINNAGNAANLIFEACDFITQTNTTDFIYVEDSVTGTVRFVNCDFQGTPTTQKFRDNANGVLRFLGNTGLADSVYANLIATNGNVNSPALAGTDASGDKMLLALGSGAGNRTGFGKQAGAMVAFLPNAVGQRFSLRLDPGGTTQASAGSEIFAFTSGNHLVIANASAPVATNKGANVTSVTATGNDSIGTIAVVMSGALAANTRIATLTFNVSYGASSPIIHLTNQTSGAGLVIVNPYATPSTGVSFDLFANQALAAGTYTFGYIVLGITAGGA